MSRRVVVCSLLHCSTVVLHDDRWGENPKVLPSNGLQADMCTVVRCSGLAETTEVLHDDQGWRLRGASCSMTSLECSEVLEVVTT